MDVGGRPGINAIALLVLWAEGGISKNPGRPRCRPPRTSRVRVIKKMIMLAKTLGRNFRGQKF